MTTGIQDRDDRARNVGALWYQLHSEREDVCEALLRNALQTTRDVKDEKLQARLGLIDDALDRLMNKHSDYQDYC